MNPVRIQASLVGACLSFGLCVGQFLPNSVLASPIIGLLLASIGVASIEPWVRAQKDRPTHTVDDAKYERRLDRFTFLGRL